MNQEPKNNLQMLGGSIYDWLSKPRVATQVGTTIPNIPQYLMSNSKYESTLPPEVQESIFIGRQPGATSNPAVPFQKEAPMQGPVLPNPTAGTSRDYSSYTPYDNNPYSSVQNNYTVTPSQGNTGNIPFSAQADAINAANGYLNTIGQYFTDRTENRGVFGLDPNKAYSPEQRESLVNKGDQIYGTYINNALTEAAKQGDANTATTLLSNTTMDPIAKNYINGYLTSGLLGTKQNFSTVVQVLSSLPDDQKIEYIKSIAYNGLGQTQKDRITDTNSAVEQIQNVFDSIPSDYTTNPYKYKLNDIIPYLGGTKDPRMNTLNAQIGNISAPIRKDYFGATLTTGESSAANQFLPDPARDDIGSIITKLKIQKAILSHRNDEIILSRVNQHAPDLSIYFEKEGLQKGGNLAPNNSLTTPTQRPGSTGSNPNAPYTGGWNSI